MLYADYELIFGWCKCNQYLTLVPKINANQNEHH